MEACRIQLVEFARVYEGRKDGFELEQLRMSIDSPEHIKEEMISMLNQRHEGLIDWLGKNGLKISTYMDDGVKKFLVEGT